MFYDFGQYIEDFILKKYIYQRQKTIYVEIGLIGIVYNTFIYKQKFRRRKILPKINVTL
jgi:hypothetical protein